MTHWAWGTSSIDSSASSAAVAADLLVTHYGHVGFVSGTIPFSAHFWAKDTITRWLENQL